MSLKPPCAVVGSDVQGGKFDIGCIILYNYLSSAWNPSHVRDFN